MSLDGHMDGKKRAGALGESNRGYCGHVQALDVSPHHSDLPEGELERRLLELGFIEGARVEILHEGLFKRDPIAVRVDDATVAIRRREAMAIIVKSSSDR